MEFLYCKNERRFYLIPDSKWFPELPPEEVEWSKNINEQRKFCEQFHSCEVLPIIDSYPVYEDKRAPFKMLAYLVQTSAGKRIVIKTRDSLTESPKYFFGRNQAIPLALLVA